MYEARAKLQEEIVRYLLGCEPNLPFSGLGKYMGFQFFFMQLHLIPLTSGGLPTEVSVKNSVDQRLGKFKVFACLWFCLGSICEKVPLGTCWLFCPDVLFCSVLSFILSSVYEVKRVVLARLRFQSYFLQQFNYIYIINVLQT